MGIKVLLTAPQTAGMILYCLLLIGCDSASGLISESTDTVVVVRVIDGDSVEVVGRALATKTRLKSIDSPELSQNNGDRAKAYLQSLIEGREVNTHCVGEDQYQRQICTIMLDEVDVNAMMIQQGWAWWYRRFASSQSDSERSLYEQLELDARESRIGLWSENNPMAPWDYRSQR